jgi:glycosyltransferase involved in cell wall biosynthesis
MILDKLIEVSKQNWPSRTIPVVSVFSWVFNHKDFIRESIESILKQKTTFPIEIIIHDDASNDGTKNILLEYQKKYPGLFRNILNEENQWSLGNSVMTPLLKEPIGKYIALSHGDDYWTDPHKLQKQVDLLEKNDNASMVFSNCQVLD